MLSWARADFRVLPRTGAVDERSLEGGAAHILMDGLVSVDEWRRWEAQLPPREAVLRVSPEARSRLEGKPVSPAEFDVLSRAKQRASVGAVLEDSGQPDAAVAEAIGTLLSRGVLTVDG
jgi:hypothetical protein